MKTINNNVAVTELKVEKTAAKAARGLDLDDGSTNNLIPATVLIASEKYQVGTVLYFRADVVRLPQARAKFKLNDLEFYLMPEELVMAVDDSNV